MTALQNLFDMIWGNETLLLWLGIVSVISFVASLFLIPFLVVRIPVLLADQVGQSIVF